MYDKNKALRQYVYEIEKEMYKITEEKRKEIVCKHNVQGLYKSLFICGIASKKKFDYTKHILW